MGVYTLLVEIEYTYIINYIVHFCIVKYLVKKGLISDCFAWDYAASI